ncbi:MAG: ribosome-associated translation inhibitor RaiA [Bacteroidia bacterium]|nr:ribosome-associated translation inhibitor RaiA [Bacteroidia bacterium]
MDIKIQSVHFDADKKLLSFIEEKVSKLKSLHDRISVSEVTLKLDKSDNNQNKIAEIRLHVPGNDLFAKKQCATFEEATDLAVDALKTQIKRYKDKA